MSYTIPHHEVKAGCFIQLKGFGLPFYVSQAHHGNDDSTTLIGYFGGPEQGQSETFHFFDNDKIRVLAYA
ncbi:hypothetical protein EBR78_08910 [bacterium]|nr:hypothetical protein [bacterium]